jgi:hypothetical protein
LLAVQPLCGGCRLADGDEVGSLRRNDQLVEAGFHAAEGGRRVVDPTGRGEHLGAHGENAGDAFA